MARNGQADTMKRFHEPPLALVKIIDSCFRLKIADISVARRNRFLGGQNSSQVVMLLFQYVGSYIEETSDYNDGSSDLMDYYYQTIEVQARQYAELAVADYYGRIRECLTAED